MRNKAHGIMFHHFHHENQSRTAQGSLSKNQFITKLSYLQKNFNLISADEWYSKAIKNDLEQKDICISFDDNLKCQFEIALPVLEEMNLNAFWFIYTSPLNGNIEKLELYRYFRYSEFNTVDSFYKNFNKIITISNYNNIVKNGLEQFSAESYLGEYSFYSKEDKKFRFIRDQILGQEKYYQLMDQMISQSGMNTEMASKKLWMQKNDIKHLSDSGHVIGLHSHSHPTNLEKSTVDKQKNEYSTCLAILRSITGKNISVMAHPSNSYNNDTLLILDELTVQVGFRANMEDGFNSRLEYPRMDHTMINSI
ncbi:MAG: polysaccharide deacetylase family protein [Flavobacteriales bacterium]|nr:polysaccharide deacetylase family protein [Flavobacteriales bacterium]